MKTALLATALALATFTLAAPAAETRSNHDRIVTEVAVPYGDLDLSNPADAAIMLTRIRAAAAKACGWKPNIRDRDAVRFYTQCMRATIDQAVARLNAPVVTALHSGRPITDTRVAHGKK